MSQEKKAQKKFHKTREDKKLEKVIALENKIKVLDDIVYKTGQSVQTMNMLNHNCKTSFVKPEFLKKAQRGNPCLYDIGCYNDNLALMLAPESDETIRLAQESRSKLRIGSTLSVHGKDSRGYSSDAENSGPIFDIEPLQKVQNDNDNYNVFANDREHPEQPEYVNDTYLEEQGDTNITIDSLYMCTNGETVNQDDDDLAKEHDLLASLIEKLKCEICNSKNRNKFLESSNKALVDKLKGEIEDFKTKNKSLESSNNHFKEAKNELSKTNQMMFKDLKKFQAELDRYHDVNYASKVEIDCAKAKGDLVSYKMESQKSFNEYTRKINDLNQTISETKTELFAHQETIFIMSQEKEAQKKFHKTREDKELEKVIALKNKIKALDDIVYKTGQSVQTMNMLNCNCKASFVKPEFLKKAQRANPRLYDIGCYNDNLALMLAPESEETIRLAQESRSKL
ncbi:copia protein, partial [Tanacetum coccineum]